jgi:hypothetical protein
MAWNVRKDAEQVAQPKIGSGHAQAWLRQGLKELGQYVPAFGPGQHVVEEPGLFGNLTPGEVAKGKEADVLLDRNQEPDHAKEQQRSEHEQQQERGGREM